MAIFFTLALVMIWIENIDIVIWKALWTAGVCFLASLCAFTAIREFVKANVNTDPEEKN